MSAQRPRPRLMRSKAVFVADLNGHVDLRTAAPLQGSYEGADVRGLFWSMVAAPGVESASPGSVDTTQVDLRLQTENAQAEARVHLLPSLPAVRMLPADGMPGAVFASLPGGRKRPAVILIGGSEGGSLIDLRRADSIARKQSPP